MTLIKLKYLTEKKSNFWENKFKIKFSLSLNISTKNKILDNINLTKQKNSVSALKLTKYAEINSFISYNLNFKTFGKKKLKINKNSINQT